MSRSAPPHIAFANRLHLACDEAGVPSGRRRVTAVAAHFGVARETARVWFAGQTLPELSRLIEIAEEYRCSLDWLATGREVPAGLGEKSSAYKALSPQEQRVVKAMRGFTAKRRSALVTLLSD